MCPVSSLAAPRRIVVTGAAGFIGSHVVDRLLAAGHHVVGVDCFTDYYSRSVKESNLAGAREVPRFEFMELDLRNDDLGPAMAGADVVIHEAAMGGLLRSWTWFPEYLTCNVLATQRVLEAVREHGVGHLVHASTSSVYGRDSSGDETRPLDPNSPYGVTKLAAENLVRAYARNFELATTILRYYSIYGPRQRPDMGYHLFIEAVLAGREITVYGDGRQTRGNTFVDDCVTATLRAAEAAGTGRVYNVGGGESVTALEAIAAIEDITGRRARIVYAPPRPGEQASALADTGAIRSALGWRPTTSFRQGLESQVRWHMGKVELADAR